MCECVWLMIVVVRVCRLCEEYVCGCGCMWVWVCMCVGVYVCGCACVCVGVVGGEIQGYVFFCDNLYYGFYFKYIQYVCLSL